LLPRPPTATLFPYTTLFRSADQASHDQPFADGLCGELHLNLTSHTPLCVGGEQTPSNPHEAGKVHFFRTPERQLAIPGTSLKGMLRNTLEIASFGRFKQVEDQRLGVRDISEANNFYGREIVSSPVQAGWLSFADGQWQIQPCEFSRLHQEQLIRHCNINKDNWTRCGTASKRYALIGLCPPVRFGREPMPKRSNQSLATPRANGEFQGNIVVTGQPGPAFDRGRSAKKYEFIFHDTTHAHLMVSPPVMAGFRQIHDSSDEWSFWLSKLNEGTLDKGIPVFFH